MPLLIAIFIAAQSHAAIFGVDDRLSVTPNSPFYTLSRSTAIAVLSSHYETPGDGSLRILAEKATNLCSNQKFSRELNLSYACSGFLVGEDLLVTAGHCMVNSGETSNQTELHCKAFSWLFDYNLGSDQRINYDGLREDNLYKCKRIVYAVKDEKAPFRDYALVQLDRKVSGRKPLKLSKLGSTKLVSMIGYPHGLSAKRSAPSSILLNNPARQSFITSLDAFEGNSGSAVFNEKNEVVGILIGGTPSHGMIAAQGRSCDVYNTCDQLGNRCSQFDQDTRVFPEFQRVGSEVQRIEPIVNLIRNL